MPLPDQHAAIAPAVMQVCATLGHGGSERVALEIADAVRVHGWRSFIAGAPGGLTDEITTRGIGLEIIPAQGYWPQDIIGNIFRLRWLIRRHGVRLLHIHNRAPGWSALAAARAEGIPVVSTYHSGYGSRTHFKRMFNSVMVRTDKVILSSEYVNGEVVKAYGPDPGNRLSIYNGIDLERFSRGAVAAERSERLLAQWGIPADRKIILMATRFTRLKGHLIAIEAVAQLKAAGVAGFVCVLAGGDERSEAYRAELEMRIAELGVRDLVLLPGVCTDMPAALSLADIVLSPSVTSENMPLARIEAAAMEVPVIGSRIGAAAELILAPPVVAESERTGWLVPAGDAGALANAMRSVLALDDATRHKLGQHARAYVEQHFNQRQSLQSTMSLYAQLMGLSEPATRS